jgi:hypothetical protein
MEREKIINIGPICRFGPGGEYISSWPAEWESPADQPKNAIARLLNILAGVVNILHGSQRRIEVIGPTEICEGTTAEQEKQLYGTKGRRADRAAYASAGSVTKHNRRFSDQAWLFADDWRAGGPAGHKPNHRIRAHRAVANKGACFELGGQGTLFDAELESAKTA